MLTCQQLAELVTEELEGSMPSLKRAQLYLHLAMCADCRELARQSRLTLQLLERLPDQPLDPGVRDELVARLKAAAAGEEPSTPWENLLPAPGALSPSPPRRSWVARAMPWVYGALALFTAAIAAGVVGATFRAGLGPLGIGGRCLATEVGLGMLVLVGVGLFAVRSGWRPSPAGWILAAVAGITPGYILLQWSCVLPDVMGHFVAFHMGGVALAAWMGVVASRVRPVAQR